MADWVTGLALMGGSYLQGKQQATADRLQMALDEQDRQFGRRYQEAQMANMQADNDFRNKQFAWETSADNPDNAYKRAQVENAPYEWWNAYTKDWTPGSRQYAQGQYASNYGEAPLDPAKMMGLVGRLGTAEGPDVSTALDFNVNRTGNTDTFSIPGRREAWTPESTTLTKQDLVNNTKWDTEWDNAVWRAGKGEVSAEGLREIWRQGTGQDRPASDFAQYVKTAKVADIEAGTQLKGAQTGLTEAKTETEKVRPEIMRGNLRLGWARLSEAQRAAKVREAQGSERIAIARYNAQTSRLTANKALKEASGGKLMTEAQYLTLRRNMANDLAVMSNKRDSAGEAAFASEDIATKAEDLASLDEQYYLKQGGSNQVAAMLKRLSAQQPRPSGKTVAPALRNVLTKAGIKDANSVETLTKRYMDLYFWSK